MGKSTPQPPAAPDPTATAAAQTGTNVNTAVAQSELNNVNRVGPGGSTTFNPTGGYTDPTSGTFVPQYTETTSLSPLGNQLLQGQQTQANDLLPVLSTEAAGATPLNVNAGPNAAEVNAGVPALNSQVADAVYGQQSSYLDPQWNLQEQQLKDQLSSQGIPIGSDAYNSAMTNFQNSKTQAYQGAKDSATVQGANTGATDFGLALQGQQQGVNLQQTQQMSPIAMLAALTSGAGIGGSA